MSNPLLCPNPACGQFSLHAVYIAEHDEPVMYVCNECNSSYSPKQYREAVLAREEQLADEAPDKTRKRLRDRLRHK